MICQIVDSSGGLPRDFVQKNNVNEVPFYFRFDSPDYLRENVDGNLTEFYRHMTEYPNILPKTAAPNINDWLSVLEKQYAKGAREYIISTISAKLSSSFQTAALAKDLFIEKNTDAKVEVIDSKTCACGQAALEIAINRMIRNGTSFQEVVIRAKELVAHINTLFVVNNLKYMAAGGRIGGATAFVGKLVQIKPVCEFVEGVVRPVKAVIGRKNSLKTMIDTAIARIADIDKMVIILQNAEFEDDADYAIDYLKKATGFCGVFYTSQLGVIVGAHSGPGAAGIGFVPNPLA